MMIEVRWYFEEYHPKHGWVSAHYGAFLSRERAVALMEARKATAPRARLRLVSEVSKKRSYRQRNMP